VDQLVNARSGAKGKLNAIPEGYGVIRGLPYGVYYRCYIVGGLETREIPGVGAEASKAQDE